MDKEQIQDKGTQTENIIALKGENSRFIDYSFGNVNTQALTINGSLNLTGIAVGNPVDGGTVNIPTSCSIVILQSTEEYTQLSLRMPLNPAYGQTLTIISIVDILNLSLEGTVFGTTKPIKIIADKPLKFIFAGKWYNC